jgi:uncharacterized membrane protein YphA (DoxX/SURF4 family)
MTFIVRLYKKFLHIASHLSPLMLFVVRMWIARVFWLSGLVSISDWGNEMYLFTHEFHVPVVSPWFAAVSSTVFEIACPVLLTLGLATRLAALPLLAITGVIYFTYDQNVEHVYWALLLGVILFVGPGKLSADYVISRKHGYHTS